MKESWTKIYQNTCTSLQNFVTKLLTIDKNTIKISKYFYFKRNLSKVLALKSLTLLQ